MQEIETVDGANTRLIYLMFEQNHSPAVLADLSAHDKTGDAMIASRHSPPVEWAATDRFATEAKELCLELERWRAERREAAARSPHEFPAFERKAAFQALFFFLALLIATYGFRYVQGFPGKSAPLFLALVLVISLPAAPLLFVFQAIGLAKAQFWRALFNWRKRPKDNYPFTSLILCLEHDSMQRTRLRRFRTSVLKTVLDRVGQEEVDLRERLSIFLGNPTILLILGGVTGTATAWQSYRTHPNSILDSILFFGSLGTLVFGALGLRMRMALLEFSRCRQLLSLEIDRRAESDFAGRRRGNFRDRSPTTTK